MEVDPISPDRKASNGAGASQPARKFKTIKGYTVQERIGRGGFSIVYRAYNHSGIGHIAACKIVALPSFTPSTSKPVADLKSLQKEVQVHRALKHLHVLEFMESVLVKDADEERERWVEGLYMLMELATHGDLFDKIAPDIGVTEDLAKLYFSQLISGLDYIHSKGICHRDLKPENLLLGSEGHLKISDFGLCAVWRHQGKTRLLTGRCGSLPYVAPELNGTGGYHAQPIDVWGAGVVLFTLLAGNTPWDEPSRQSPEFCAYLTGELLQYEPWNRIKGDALSLLLACLEVDPKKRITISEMRTHPWLMTPSQIQRHDIPYELTRGLRQTGMMDVVEPPRSQIPNRGGPSQAYGEGLSQMDSQFMQATAIRTTCGGSYIADPGLTRFRLALSHSETLNQVTQTLIRMIGENGTKKSSSGDHLQIGLKDRRKQTMTGEVRFQVDDGWGMDVTLVLVNRSKGDPLEWRRFWWNLVNEAGLRELIVKPQNRLPESQF